MPETCITCRKEFEINKDVIIKDNEINLCYKCICKVNLPLKISIKYTDICIECECLFDKEKVINMGINHTENKCFECLVHGLKTIECNSTKKKLCSNKNCKNCYYKSFASYYNSFLWNERNIGCPRNYFLQSDRKFFFNCIECGHIFYSQLKKIILGRWCHFCNNQLLCLSDNCKSCFNKSFASNKKAIYWNFEKNECNPRDIFKSCNKNYYFNCNCGHEISIKLGNITHLNNWCCYCTNKKLCTENCDLCFNKSFASHEKSKYWLYEKNDSIIPRNVFKGSDQCFYFCCINCKHTFQSRIAGICSGGNWCIYCAKQKLCNSKDCDWCFNNSFASQKQAKFWDFGLNKLEPRDTFKCSGNKFYFICKEKHSFSSSLNNIIKGQWCSKCKEKTEGKVYEFLLTISKVVHQYKAEWCKSDITKYHYPFDFFLPEHKLLIEIDGRQHFEDMECWNLLSIDSLERDTYKNKKALENGYSMLRIYQPDIFKDRIDWKKIIIDIIEIVKTLKKSKIFFYASTNIYDKQIELMKKFIEES